MTTQLPQPNLDQAAAVLGEHPSNYPPTAASLSLGAGRLILRYEPWWTIKCGYTWFPVGGEMTIPLVGSVPGGIVSYELHRASIPASFWAALAIAKSGGNESYYRETGVKVAGLFAVPVEIAAREGFDPMSVFDSLRYTRLVIESQLVAWKNRQVPGPACATMVDYLYCSLFQYLAGGLSATAIFGAIRNPTQTAILESIRTGAGIDWSSASFAGIGRDGVSSAALMASDIIAASNLLEGWAYAARPGAIDLEVDALPDPPVTGTWINPWPQSGQMRVSTRRTTGGPESLDSFPSSLSWLRTSVPRIYPWEDPEDSTSRSGYDIDPYQLQAIKTYGHYPTRVGVLEVLVPSLPHGDAIVPHQGDREITRTAGSSRTWLVVGSILAGTAALAVGAVVAVSRKPRRRSRRRVR